MFFSLLTVAVNTAKTYTPFPTAPVFSDATAWSTTSTGKNFGNTELAGNLEVTFTPGQTANISTTYSVGTAAAPVKFKSLDPNNKTIVGDGTVTTNACFRASSNSRHVELYDLILYRNNSGIAWLGNANDANPSTIFVQNVESHKHSFASYFVNGPSVYYAKINSNFLRYFDLDDGAADGTDGGEGLYIGSTSPSTRTTIYESKHYNLYGYGAAREGIQITSAREYEVANATIRNSGTWGAAGGGQNRLVQTQFSWGIIRDTIFDGSPSSWEVQGTNMVFYNCLFKWMNGDRPYIGNSSNGLGGSEVLIDNGPIIFDSCIFKTNLTGQLLLVQNKGVDIIVRNCIISDNVTSLFYDNRGASPANSLIDGGGNVYLPNASIPDPTYAIEPGYDLHLTYANTAAMTADQASQTAGRRYLAGSEYYTRKPTTTASINDYIVTPPAYVVADDYYYNRFMGYRTPPDPLAPTSITLSDNTIDEGNSTNAVIGTLGTTGGSGSYTYEILSDGYGSDDAAAFNISGTSLRASAVFDYSTKSSYQVRVRSKSATNSMRYVDKTFAITIGEVTTPTVATDIVLSSTNIDEGVAIGTVVGTLSDNGIPSSTWSLVAGTGSTDNAKFSITGNSLEIEEVPDYGTQPSYAIRIRSTNTANGGLTYEEQFVIDVNEVIVAPLHKIINFGGDAGTGVADPAIAGTESVWVGGVSTTNVTYNLTDGIDVVLVNTASNYWGDGAEASGFVTLTGSGQYHNSVIGSWINTAASRSAGVRIDGLDPGATYTLKIGGFRPNSGTARSTNYTIGGTTIAKTNNWSGTDNQADNDAQFAIFTGISPNGSGQILITVQTNGTSFGYLNVIEITEE